MAENQVPEWSTEYLPYKKLKKLLKALVQKVRTTQQPSQGEEGSLLSPCLWQHLTCKHATQDTHVHVRARTTPARRLTSHPPHPIPSPPTPNTASSSSSRFKFAFAKLIVKGEHRGGRGGAQGCVAARGAGAGAQQADEPHGAQARGAHHGKGGAHIDESQPVPIPTPHPPRQPLFPCRVFYKTK
jgi:hypothetical protein